MVRSDDAADGRMEAKPYGTRLPDPESCVASPRCIINRTSSALLGSWPGSRRRGLDMF
jgi:hypothetical protein